MTKNYIAVIMSVYINDTLDYVQESVNSILNQTYEQFHLYIQYDGKIKTDVDSYLSSLDESCVFISKRAENKGLAYSLNELLSIVLPKGYEYIARMDADDICMLDRFEKQISYLEIHGNIDCLGGAIFEIDEKGHSRGKVTKYPCDYRAARDFFKKRNPVAHPTVMFRKSFFDKIRCFYPTDYERNEDTMLWYMAYKNDIKIANLPDVLLKFRMTDATFTTRRNGRVFAKSQLEMRKMINRDLHYGKIADIYAYAMYLLMVSPAFLRKLAYKILR